MININILLIRSLDILSDSRVQRYENYFKQNNLPYRILGWDRDNKGIKREHTDYCTIQANYNLGVKGIKYRMRWNAYIFKYLIGHRKKYDIIHACDFDTIIPSLFMKLFGKRVIFDIFDWFSDEVHTGNKIIDFTINTLEKLSVKLADLTILCEEERINQIGCKPKKKIIIPNIPNMYIDIREDIKPNEEQDIVIGYVGGFYPDRGLVELIELVSNTANIKLRIAGFGNKDIENKAIQYSRQYSNIAYYGKVAYDEAVQIMMSCDILYAMYYKVNRNNVFAAPNKFYESIFLEKPIITTKGTLVGDKVEKEQIGFIIEEGYDALKSLLKDLDKVMLISKTEALQKCSEKYKHRFANCMIEYAKFIKEEK